MQDKFKPNGYNSVSPYIMVGGAQKLIDMLVQIFDAKEKRRYTRSDGSIMHAEIQIDDSVLMLAEANDKYPAYQFWMHIYVPNVDMIFEKAISYGCEIIERPIEKEGDSDRRGTFKDFAGNFWAIATQVREEK
ncbi:MAG: VOC family protein [Cyclobacteriaceae bacterium]|nr:VOC family protein [Cyclobacteriaceae bacterium]